MEMGSLLQVVCLLSLSLHCCRSVDQKLPVVVNTWPFVHANEGAVQALKNGSSYIDAVEKGCSVCEVERCNGSVGYGGSPNDKGETTLDAMIMDGESHNVGAVGCLKEIKSAISVARNVMERTTHTILVGDDATAFAVEMGFKKEDLTTDDSRKIDRDWVNQKCQPNFWVKGTVTPDPTTTCGPFQPGTHFNKTKDGRLRQNLVDPINHDTIGMIVVDAQGKIACGTSTNGLTHKIAGRVGDSPIVGAGCYVEKGVGGAAATGDGDVMMRFLPAYRVVENMNQGMTPKAAVDDALARITKYYPNFKGALIAVNISGDYAGAGHGGVGYNPYSFTVYNPILGESTVVTEP